MKRISTFSIVARDPDTDELGIAVQSKFLAVGAAVPWARAGAGAIATQSLANLDYGKIGLKLLKKGYTAQQALNALLAMDDSREDRQIGIVDATGNSAAYTGKNCFEWAGHITGHNFACQGNILVGSDTVRTLADSFQSSKGALANRLVEALSRAQDAGGDRRGRQSSSLLVVKEGGSYGGYNDRYIDLRVDDDPEPIKKLSHLLKLHNLYFEKTRPEDMVKIDQEVSEKVQRALNKLGYYKGEINSIFDKKTSDCYWSFCGVENFEERICDGNYLDRKVLEFLIKKAEEV